MKKILMLLALATVPLVASCGTDDSADLEQEVADQAATIDLRDEEIANLEQEVADQAATIESLNADIADLEGVVADQDSTIESLETELAALTQQAAEEASAWFASLEASIEAALNEQWAGEFAEHDLSCPVVPLGDLAAGDEFTCQAECECVPDPTMNIRPTEIKVTYEGDGTASWVEVLEPTASGPGPDGAPASGTFSG